MCGNENSNAKTIGYTYTLVFIILLFSSYGTNIGRIDSDSHQKIKNDLETINRMYPKVVDKTKKWLTDHPEFSMNLDNITFLGSGINVGTSMEGMLKLLETQGVPTMYNEIEEFQHGMHRTINKNSRVVLFKNDPTTEDIVERTYRYLQGVSNNILLLDGTNSLSDEFVISYNCNSELLSVFFFTAVVQTLSVMIPEQNGLDPNRNLNDDLTVELKTRV